MNCFFIIFVTVALSTANAGSLSDDIVQYFKSNSVKNLRKIWDDHRQSVEHALASALQDTIGKDGLNVFTMKPSHLRLTNTYYHVHGPVGILFKDLDLVQLPYCWLPDAVFSLASNALKIETTLTKMVINAEYMLIRNASDIINEKSEQDPYKRSPFLFKQVLNKGQITILVDGCMLSGYVITRLKGGTVDLGHEKFMLTNCEYSVEIYNKDSGVPPVIVEYSDKKPANSLEIKHYLLRLLRDEFITKLEATIYSYMNTSAIFGQNLPAHEEEQHILFSKTSSNLTKLTREQNQKILNLNSGAVDIAEYYNTWDYWDQSCSKAYSKAGVIKLSKMFLTGLGTAYHSFTGGPFKLDTVMIGEQIRFNTLQVRGELYNTMPNAGAIDFSIEIIDFAINIEIDVEGDGIGRPKSEVVGYRKIELATQVNITVLERILITGYVVDEVSKAIIRTITTVSMMPASSNTQSSGNIYSLSNKESKNSSLTVVDGSRVKIEGERKGKELRESKRNHKTHKHVVNNEVPKD